MVADNKKLYIPDASVLLKWALDEIEDKAKALNLRSDFIIEKIDFLLPSHCYYEIMNTLNIKAPELATTFFSKLLTMNITEQRLSLELTHLAGSIMQKIPKTSFYDAIYHACAIHNNGTFITADEKYYQKAKKLKHIQLLKNY